ncbi:unnamed protein product [Symbiodinium natans]|uniref:Uncharacterized protein n=1 Tax=Symbiodinium natans TaxID=878477 RepID=A0A812L8I6_9DINO|nr:unnamed protein product [Symbiodinium natans]
MLHGSSAVRHALGLQRTQVLPDLTKIPPDLYRQAWAMLTKVPEGFHIDSKKEIARWFFGALGIVLACTFLGKLWDLLLPPNKGQRIPRWVVTMVVSSYILMFPGIIYPVITVDVHVTDPKSGLTLPAFATFMNYPGDVLNESMWGIIKLLFPGPASFLVGFYGLVVPAIKFVLFAKILKLKEFSKRTAETTASLRYNVSWLRFVSKWDSPKLFAYVVLLELFGMVSHEPEVHSRPILNKGFALYLVFSIGTLLASVAIPDDVRSLIPGSTIDDLQEVDETSETTPAADAAAVTPKPEKKEATTPTFFWLFGERHMLPVTLGLLLVFLIALSLALCMNLFSMTYKPKYWLMGPYEESFKALGVPETGGASGMGRIMGKALTRLESLDVSAVMCTLLIVIFTLGFTCLDMFALTIASYHVSRSVDQEKDVKKERWARALKFVKFAHLYQFLSMLDVFIVGSVVSMITTLASLAGAGFYLSFDRGMIFVFLAEGIHIMTHVAVSNFINEKCEQPAT